ncbi:MAG TPA: hypothetical protein VGV38_01050, partial [Pyrinomonadaceae bacterium]|nr:hypothetical protein [Pyrinomonadaceae bacterium]
ADEARVVVRHARFGFVVFELPLGEGMTDEQVSSREVVGAELERLRALGVEVPKVLEVVEGGNVGPSSDESHVSDGSPLSNEARPSEVSASLAWPELSAPCRRWLGWTLPFVRFLLARAFGVESLTDEQVACLLLLRDARLYCTATHVDVLMSLEQIDTDVRRSGLDATPGWVRDLARVVTIHFD